MKNKSITIISMLALLGAGVANAQVYVINGNSYVPEALTENVAVGSWGPQTAQSTNQYSGFILISGAGYYYFGTGDIYSDIFYAFHFSDSSYYLDYGLLLNTNQMSQASYNSLGGFAIAPIDPSLNLNEVTPALANVPAYTTTHSYNVVVDVGVSNPTTLYFGVGDSYWGDNSGSFNLQITQLQAVAPILPMLTLTGAGTNILLMWPTNATGFALQSTADLVSQSSWSSVFPLPVVIGTNNVVTNSILGTSRFYRLVQ